MKLIGKVVPRTHNVYLISDSHEGTILKHNTGYKKVIQEIKDDPIGYLAHLGDMSEGITVDDKRYCHQTIDPNTTTPVRQYNAVVDELEPVKDKILAILEGNHDWKISAKYGSLVRDVVCARLSGDKDPDFIYGTYSCKLSMSDSEGNLMYKMFLTHGFGSINSKAADRASRTANNLKSLKGKLMEKASDCVIMAMGHTHKLLIRNPVPKLCLTDDLQEIRQDYTKLKQVGNDLDEDMRWYINTGCFYKLYEMGVSGYAERAGYDPNELGYVVIHVEDGIIKDVERRVI